MCAYLKGVCVCVLHTDDERSSHSACPALNLIIGLQSDFSIVASSHPCYPPCSPLTQTEVSPPQEKTPRVVTLVGEGPPEGGGGGGSVCIRGYTPLVKYLHLWFIYNTQGSGCTSPLTPSKSIISDLSASGLCWMRPRGDGGKMRNTSGCPILRLSAVPLV